MQVHGVVASLEQQSVSPLACAELVPGELDALDRLLQTHALCVEPVDADSEADTDDGVGHEAHGKVSRVSLMREQVRDAGHEHRPACREQSSTKAAEVGSRDDKRHGQQLDRGHGQQQRSHREDDGEHPEQP